MRPLYTIQELAHALRLQPGTVRNKLSRGEDMPRSVLDLTRLSGHFMFTKEGDQDGEVTAEIYTGVSPPDGGAAPDWTQI